MNSLVDPENTPWGLTRKPAVRVGGCVRVSELCAVCVALLVSVEPASRRSFFEARSWPCRSRLRAVKKPRLSPGASVGGVAAPCGVATSDASGARTGAIISGAPAGQADGMIDAAGLRIGAIPSEAREDNERTLGPLPPLISGAISPSSETVWGRQRWTSGAHRISV